MCIRDSLSGVISDRHIRDLIEEFESLKESLIANDIADNNAVSYTHLTLPTSDLV